MKKQFTKNLALNIFAFCSNIIIGLLLTPYLIKHLGLLAYGLIPLAMFFSQYIGVILNSINMSINRFLLVALQQNDNKQANKIFSTSLVIIIIFILIQALIMALVLFNIQTVFTIPVELLTDATWLFGLTFIGFSLSLLRSVYGTSLFAYNRLDILRMIDVIHNISRVIIILAFFYYDSPSLIYIGLSNLMASMIAFVVTVIYFKKYTPQLKTEFKSFDKTKVRELSKMSTWILINQVGALLLGNVDLYLVNKILGTQSTGNYAIVSQVVSLFRTLATLVSGVIAPVIMIYYANKQFDQLKKIVIVSAKFMIMVLVVPMGLFIGFSQELVGLWLGLDYQYLYVLISFSLLFYVIAFPMMPLYNVNMAFNKVKIPALIVIAFGILNVISMYVLLNYSDLGLWAVVFTKLVFEILFAGVFMPLYVSKILSIAKGKILSIPIMSIFLFLTSYYFVVVIKSLITIDSFLKIVLVSVFIGGCILTLFLWGILQKQERLLVFENFNLKKLLKK